MENLPQQTFNQLKDILGQYPEVQQAILFGSYATGKFHAGSDIDLILYGDEELCHKIDLISIDFEESTIPQKVDLIFYHDQLNAQIKADIQQYGVSIFNKNNISTQKD
jgi:predicted nucleotidyltransferase